MKITLQNIIKPFLVSKREKELADQSAHWQHWYKMELADHVKTLERLTRVMEQLEQKDEQITRLTLQKENAEDLYAAAIGLRGGPKDVLVPAQAETSRP